MSGSNNGINVASKSGSVGKPKISLSSGVTQSVVSKLASALSSPTNGYPPFRQALVLSDLLASASLPAGTTTVQTLAHISTDKMTSSAEGFQGDAGNNKTAKLFALKSALSPLNMASHASNDLRTTSNVPTATCSLPLAGHNLPLGSVIQLTQLVPPPPAGLTNPYNTQPTGVSKIAGKPNNCTHTCSKSKAKQIGASQGDNASKGKAQPRNSISSSRKNATFCNETLVNGSNNPLVPPSTCSTMGMLSNFLPASIMSSLAFPSVSTVTTVTSSSTSSIPVMVSTGANGSLPSCLPCSTSSLLPISSSIVNTKNGQIAVLWVPGHNGKPPTAIGLTGAGNQQFSFVPMLPGTNVPAMGGNSSQLTSLMSRVMANGTVYTTASLPTKTSNAPTLTSKTPNLVLPKIETTQTETPLIAANNSTQTAVNTLAASSALTNLKPEMPLNGISVKLEPKCTIAPTRSNKRKVVPSVDATTQTDAEDIKVEGETITVNQISLGGDRIELMFTSSAPPAIGRELQLTPSPSLSRLSKYRKKPKQCASLESASPLSSILVDASLPSENEGEMGRMKSNLIDDIIGTGRTALLSGLDPNLNTAALEEMGYLGHSEATYSYPGPQPNGHLLFNHSDHMLSSNSIISPVPSMASSFNTAHTSLSVSSGDSMDLGQETSSSLDAITNGESFSELFAYLNGIFGNRQEEFSLEQLGNLIENERLNKEDFPISDANMVHNVLFNLETEPFEVFLPNAPLQPALLEPVSDKKKRQFDSIDLSLPFDTSIFPTLNKASGAKKARPKSKKSPVSPLSMAILGAIETTTKSLADCGSNLASTTPTLNGLLMSTGTGNKLSALNSPPSLSSPGCSPPPPSSTISNNSLLAALLSAKSFHGDRFLHNHLSYSPMGPIKQEALSSSPLSSESTKASNNKDTSKSPSSRPTRQRPPKKPKVPNTTDSAVSSTMTAQSKLQPNSTLPNHSSTAPNTALTLKDTLQKPVTNLKAIKAKQPVNGFIGKGETKSPAALRNRKKPATIPVSSIISSFTASNSNTFENTAGFATSSANKPAMLLTMADAPST